MQTHLHFADRLRARARLVRFGFRRHSDADAMDVAANTIERLCVRLRERDTEIRTLRTQLAAHAYGVRQ